jgi:DNA polymerase-1
LVKKFNIKTDKAISFIPNYELDDWAVLFTNIYEAVEHRINTLKLERVLKEIEMPLPPVLVRMERQGILLDKKVLKKIRDKIHLEILILEEEIYDLTGSKFNINSPKQLTEVLFEKLKLPTKGLAKTTTKSISTNSDELEKILESHEVIPKIIRFKELKKLENSFLDTLPTFMKADDRIHTTFVQTGTATGRLSSDTPNLQNIPIKGDYGKLVRKAFVAEAGYDLVSCDYSQMELRIAAKLANDKLMMKAFETGKDFHRYTASLVNHIDYEKVTSEQRNKAKALNFGIIYGMGMRSFSQSANISKEEARAFVEEYFENYFGLRNFLDSLKARAKDKGYCETLYGRKRFLSFIGAYGFQAAMEERIAINMPIQGLAADIIKVAMIKIHKYLKEKGSENDIRMLLQIHDELIFEVKEGISDKEVFECIDKIMEENDFGILLRADKTRAENWGDLKN